MAYNDNPNRTGNPPSSLAISRLCGLAPILKKSSGIGRGAVVSSAVHAHWSGAPDAPDLMAKLTEEERADIATWKKPQPLAVKMTGGEAQAFSYDEANKEEYVCCDELGFGTGDDVPHLLGGTVDFFFLASLPSAHGDKRIVLVCDLKKTPFSSPEGPDGLQLAAYGLAACAKYDADGYLPAFWYLEQGEWNVGNLVMLSTPKARAILREVVIAAKNRDGKAVTGDHCDSCWERAHCPEYLALGIKGNDAFTKALRGDELTADEAYQALVAAEAATDAGKLVRDRLRAMVRERSVEITNPKGKRWLPVIQSGRRSGPSVKQCEEMGRADLIRQGADYEQMKWVNGRKSG